MGRQRVEARKGLLTVGLPLQAESKKFHLQLDIVARTVCRSVQVAGNMGLVIGRAKEGEEG